MSNFRIFSIGASAAFIISTIFKLIVGSVPDMAVANVMAYFGFWAVMCWGDRR